MKLLSNTEYNRLQAAIVEKKDYISPREYEYLRNEIIYWREKYEVERKRTDRAVDTLVESTGQLPISDLGLTKAVAKKSAADALFDKHQHELSELYADQINDITDISTSDLPLASENPELIEISE